ncbi:MAG: YgeY family selenium metabolism-linked hydrolase [Anaerolineales bacterium]|nr:YgeY family selenium metabolism-linked hydrolase [Anaerolineales bacterium]
MYPKAQPQIFSYLKPHEKDIRTFMRELCAINSVDGQIRSAAERTAAEMEKLGFHSIRTDRMGCLIGAVGNGPVKILYDAHLDTVGVGDPEEWDWDPFTGRLKNGKLYARGACDTKGCIPGMVYGLAAAAEAGVLDSFTLYYYGSLEEQCDGLAPRVLVEEEGLRPDFVVIGEPTDMAVFRAQRGRVEMAVHFSGKSAHASMPGVGVNPTYKMAPFLLAMEQLNQQLVSRGDGLARGSVAVTDLSCQTASINAVPSGCTAYLDRRLGIGEKPGDAIAEIRACIPGTLRNTIAAELMIYKEPSYTGYVRETEKVFPAWELPLEDPYVQAGLRAAEAALQKPVTTGGWPASTNGAYWRGTAGIPSIGFGPGELLHAHSLQEQVRMEDVVTAARFYALLPLFVPID